MFTFKVFLFVLSISVVKSDEEFTTLCKNDYRDANNTKINVEEYCANKLCIEKCCGKNEYLFVNQTCLPKTTLKGRKRMLAQFDTINYLSSVNVNKTSKKDVVFIYNHRNIHKCTAEHLITDEYEILEVTVFNFLALVLFFKVNTYLHFFCGFVHFFCDG